jgi:hypothetical protein
MHAIVDDGIQYHKAFTLNTITDALMGGQPPSLKAGDVTTNSGTQSNMSEDTQLIIMLVIGVLTLIIGSMLLTPRGFWAQWERVVGDDFVDETDAKFTRKSWRKSVLQPVVIQSPGKKSNDEKRMENKSKKKRAKMLNRLRV